MDNVSVHAFPRNTRFGQRTPPLVAITTCSWRRCNIYGCYSTPSLLHRFATNRQALWWRHAWLSHCVLVLEGKQNLWLVVCGSLPAQLLSFQLHLLPCRCYIMTLLSSLMATCFPLGSGPLHFLTIMATAMENLHAMKRAPLGSLGSGRHNTGHNKLRRKYSRKYGALWTSLEGTIFPAVFKRMTTCCVL